MEENCNIPTILSAQRNSKLKKIYQSRPQIKASQSLSNNIANFDKYISGLDQTLDQVNKNQLEQLKKKYRFYLSKVQKLQQTRNSLQQKFDSIEEIVENSVQVKQQKNSINFITVITEDANHKFEELMKKVEKQKQQKKIHNKQILHLKQLLKKQKDKFFEAKRIEANIKYKAEAQQKANKLQNADCTFKSIVIEKKLKQKQKIKNKSKLKIESNQYLNCCNTQQNEIQDVKEQTEYSQFQQSLYLPEINKKSKQIQYKNGININQHLNQCEFNQAKTYTKMSKTTALFNQYQSNLEKDSKAKIRLSNKIFQLKNKSIMSEINGINKLKNQFIKQTSSYQHKNLQVQQKLSKNHQFQLNSKLTNKTMNKDRQQKQKLSLDQQQFLKSQQKGKQIWKRKQQLKQENQKKIREEEMRKQNFLKMQPQQIIKHVIYHQRLQDILKLMQNDKNLICSSKAELKLIR